MELVLSKPFLRSYKSLSPTAKERTDAALALFQQDPFHRDLRNHEPKGKLKGFRSVSAGFDLRVVFTPEDESYAVVVLVKVGTHNQVC